MKNGIETRSNGVRIFKIQGKVIPLYYVEGSKNGPWDYLYNARTDADALATPNEKFDISKHKFYSLDYVKVQADGNIDFTVTDSYGGQCDGVIILDDSIALTKHFNSLRKQANE